MLSLTPAGAAEVLGVSVGALKSLLQRARARVARAPLSEADLAEPSSPDARRVLDAYMAAFAQSDMAALEHLLAADAVLEMTGTPTWFSGKATCAPYLAAFAIGAPGDWRMAGLRANGQLGAAAYRRDADGTYQAFAVVVLATNATELKRISLFTDPGLFPVFGLPATLPPRPLPSRYTNVKAP